MEIEIRLRALLRKHGYDAHGIQETLAKHCHCHRHSIAKLMLNKATNPSLETLGALCDWLAARMPKEDLPRALFGAKPDKLWRLIIDAKRATVYLGEYHQISDDPKSTPMAVRWLSRRDVEVVGALTRAFSRKSDGHHPVLTMKYVPVRYSEHAGLPRRELTKDVEFSRAVFANMRSEARNDVSLIIGSQRVSHVTEHLVADLFGCEPFRAIRGARPGVPFHLVFRGKKGLSPFGSCFGGLRNPPGRTGRVEPGIYYLDAAEQWCHCPWESERVDSGVVITSYHSNVNSLELAIFGFSGRGTEAIGRSLIKDSQRFWGSEVESGNRRVGVYICRFDLIERQSPKQGEVVEAENLKVTPLTAKVLERYVR